MVGGEREGLFKAIWTCCWLRMHTSTDAFWKRGLKLKRTDISGAFCTCQVPTKANESWFLIVIFFGKNDHNLYPMSNGEYISSFVS